MHQKYHMQRSHIAGVCYVFFVLDLSSISLSLLPYDECSSSETALPEISKCIWWIQSTNILLCNQNKA